MVKVKEIKKAWQQGETADSFHPSLKPIQCVSIDQEMKRGEEGERGEKGESKSVDTDPDGIVYLLWPRLDF